LIHHLTQAFGGVHYIPEKERVFIENWEVEAFRRKIALKSSHSGRLQGKIAVITGGAQGFGKGIADGLAKEGACVCIADLNLNGAEKTAQELCNKYGILSAFAEQVDVADENSIVNMLTNIVRKCGGIDIFISNAGVLKAGRTPTFDKKDWDFVTNINYTGYFLCVKHAAPIMIKQNAISGKWTDIIQINSKSGLAGSNKNAAYAGSKFGTIGLTQSFALEFVENKIKVNSICPGNYFDGPLWSDPKKGLFKQYLESGKVPGAKTIKDVKQFYESKVPMQRGCYPEDVVKAILYVIEQNYETGQAIPVTGGQIMLN
ncbi:MAG: SDR family NAD(P)-dependent oxidoreductase, partial [Bacteroidetes bacterium]